MTTYAGVWGSRSAEIIDRIVEIHEELAGESDEEIAAACMAYLDSDERKYRRAMESPKPRLVWDADAREDGLKSGDMHEALAGSPLVPPTSVIGGKADMARTCKYVR
jgi:hypothetical protein